MRMKQVCTQSPLKSHLWGHSGNNAEHPRVEWTGYSTVSPRPLWACLDGSITDSKHLLGSLIQSIIRSLYLHCSQIGSLISAVS